MTNPGSNVLSVMDAIDLFDAAMALQAACKSTRALKSLLKRAESFAATDASRNLLTHLRLKITQMEDQIGDE